MPLCTSQFHKDAFKVLLFSLTDNCQIIHIQNMGSCMSKRLKMKLAPISIESHTEVPGGSMIYKSRRPRRRQIWSQRWWSRQGRQRGWPLWRQRRGQRERQGWWQRKRQGWWPRRHERWRKDHRRGTQTHRCLHCAGQRRCPGLQEHGPRYLFWIMVSRKLDCHAERINGGRNASNSHFLFPLKKILKKGFSYCQLLDTSLRRYVECRLSHML